MSSLAFLTYLLEVRPSSEFSYEPAKNKLVNLELPRRILTRPEHKWEGSFQSAQAKAASDTQEGGHNALVCLVSDASHTRHKTTLGPPRSCQRSNIGAVVSSRGFLRITKYICSSVS